MQQIRRNVFETNSSSSHSLVILTDNIAKETENDIYFTHAEMLASLHGLVKGVYKSSERSWYFGRSPFRALNTFELKFQYAYACAWNYSRPELVQLLQELVPEVKTFIPPEDAGTDDHLLSAWLNDCGITMKEFLTNKKYIVMQDGDEFNIWKDLKSSGLINFNAIEHEEA